MSGDGTGDSAAPDATPVTIDGAYFIGCHITETSLRLCLDFEEPALAPTLKDGSSFQHDATSVNVLPMTRAGEQAAMFGSASSASIPKTPDFDLPALSLEAWMKPDNVYPASWAIYNAQHYGIGISGGNIVCAVGDKVTSTDATPYVGQWVHVACTSNDMNLTLYVNGNAVDCSSGTRLKGTNDLGIGVGLSGGVDNVRLFAAVLPPTEICAHAGQTACTTACTRE
jgi:hypothetical protein